YLERKNLLFSTIQSFSIGVGFRRSCTAAGEVAGRRSRPAASLQASTFQGLLGVGIDEDARDDADGDAHPMDGGILHFRADQADVHAEARKRVLETVVHCSSLNKGPGHHGP